jgi:hypothetical protein
MTKRNQKYSVQELVRRRGAPPRPEVNVLKSEVRSDDVPILPPPVPPQPDGLLGGIVVIWEFCVPHDDVQEFHEFLLESEDFIRGALLKVAKGAHYRGTYIQLTGRDACCRSNIGPCYRTIWAYESLEAMARAWETALKEKNSNLFKFAARLRAFWLSDPDRTEGRFAPAFKFFDPKNDNGDAFSRLTLAAAKLNASRRRPRPAGK